MSAAQKEVWSREQDYFRYLNARNLAGFISFWDDGLVGWPDYRDHPVRNPEIRASVEGEFRGSPTASPPLPAPKPEAVETFGNVVITDYFWPEANETSLFKYRVMHTWQRGTHGWHIIGGMDCEVPRSAQSTPLASARSHEQPLTKNNDKAAVEATVRDYEEAVQEFDFARADSLLAQNAKWIERSAPEDAAFGQAAGFWAEARATKVRVKNEPHDFDIHVQGDVAWATLLVDVTMGADNEGARALLARSETEETGKASDPGQREWSASYTETEVLVKTPNGWRIALGHTSQLPTKPN